MAPSELSPHSRPDTRSRRAASSIPRARRLPVLAIAGALAALAVVGWTAWLYGQIRYYALADGAHHADAIAVFGAAEYDGRPSPVLRARLEHAFLLYQRGLAPYIVTLGGGDGGEQHSEGSVGQNFLEIEGVPSSSIVAETQSRDTEASARQLASIAQAYGFRSILAVSDGTHLFRIQALLRSYGLVVYTSPRPRGKPIGALSTLGRLLHEMASYTLWRLHLH